MASQAEGPRWNLVQWLQYWCTRQSAQEQARKLGERKNSVTSLDDEADSRDAKRRWVTHFLIEPVASLRAFRELDQIHCHGGAGSGTPRQRGSSWERGCPEGSAQSPGGASSRLCCLWLALRWRCGSFLQLALHCAYHCYHPFCNPSWEYTNRLFEVAIFERAISSLTRIGCTETSELPECNAADCSCLHVVDSSSASSMHGAGCRMRCCLRGRCARPIWWNASGRRSSMGQTKRRSRRSHGWACSCPWRPQAASATSGSALEAPPPGCMWSPGRR